jgi:hypothetical protein
LNHAPIFDKPAADANAFVQASKIARLFTGFFTHCPQSHHNPLLREWLEANDLRITAGLVHTRSIRSL